MESANLIDTMTKIVAGSDNPKKSFYTDLMTEVLARIRQSLEIRP